VIALGTNYDDRPDSAWTGDMVLELRNGRDWSSGVLEVGVHRDTVRVRHGGSLRAELDRDVFRAWLIRPSDTTLSVDDTVWSMDLGVVCVALRYVGYTVKAESISLLLQVI
jgi:hypothetical protein